MASGTARGEMPAKPGPTRPGHQSTERVPPGRPGGAIGDTPDRKPRGTLAPSRTVVQRGRLSARPFQKTPKKEGLEAVRSSLSERNAIKPDSA
jgi:hypothetical protein